MVDVADGLFEFERAEVVADGNALIEGLEGSKAELVRKVRMPEENEGQGRSRVHLVVEQETELVKEVMRKKMCFVDDEKDETAPAGQIRECGAELREEACKAKGRLGLKGKEDLAIESGGREMRVGEIDDGVEVVVEGVGKGAKSGGFSSADVACDEGRETGLESKGKTGLNLLMTTRREQILAADGFGKREDGKTIKVIDRVHHLAPCRWRSHQRPVWKSEWYPVFRG
jgi:hypothetical protein